MLSSGEAGKCSEEGDGVQAYGGKGRADQGRLRHFQAEASLRCWSLVGKSMVTRVIPTLR